MYKLYQPESSPSKRLPGCTDGAPNPTVGCILKLFNPEVMPPNKSAEFPIGCAALDKGLAAEKIPGCCPPNKLFGWPELIKFGCPVRGTDGVNPKNN